MNLLPKSHEEFSQKEYWDNFFKKRGNKAFEWYGEYPELCLHLHKYIKPKDNVLIVGCGNSTLGRDLYDIGYRKVTNIDISQVVIRQMQQANSTRLDLKFIQMDATAMSFEDQSFSVVLDKGTLDALMPNEEAETIARIDKYFSEISRVLSVGGRYVCISLLQEHILQKILAYFPSNNWMLRIVRCYEPEKKAEENGEHSMPVFLVVATKFLKLPMQVLEVNMGIDDKMQRMTSTNEVFSLVTQVQKAAFVCAGLQRGLLADQNEVSFDLYQPGQNSPRYTVYVVDIPINRSFSQYAAFIVPQGREAEWLFSTTEGRKMLANMTKNNRLAVILLHRKQNYDSLKVVQDEMEDIVKNLAPSGMNNKILFLSLGSDVGQRTIRYEGHSSMSGDYIVEDVEIDNEKFRRLYYMDAQNVIQSEAKLSASKSKKNSVKDVVDGNYLTCKYHKYMSIGVHMATQTIDKPEVAIIGLGGGGLCSFLRNFTPNVSILGIDIDEDMFEVAKTWFGLKEDDKLKVEIIDGLEFLKNTSKTGKKYSAILFDVDNKDTSIGMSCPPKQFLEEDTLKEVSSCLDSSGLFILNVVLRDDSLRPSIIEKVKQKFPTVLSYKLSEDLNEIIIASPVDKCEEKLMAQFKKSNDELNRFFKKKKLHMQVELDDVFESLKINE